MTGSCIGALRGLAPKAVGAGGFGKEFDDLKGKLNDVAARCSVTDVRNAGLAGC